MICYPEQQAATSMVCVRSLSCLGNLRVVSGMITSQLRMTRELTYSCIPGPASCQLLNLGAFGYGANGEKWGQSCYCPRHLGFKGNRTGPPRQSHLYRSHGLITFNPAASKGLYRVLLPKGRSPLPWLQYIHPPSAQAFRILERAPPVPSKSAT